MPQKDTIHNGIKSFISTTQAPANMNRAGQSEAVSNLSTATSKVYRFHVLPENLAASTQISFAEKLLASYIYTICKHRKMFRGSDDLLAKKLCITKKDVENGLLNLSRIGLIESRDNEKNKREITWGTAKVSAKFYKLYFPIAESNLLDAEEKILLTYILSFHDNGKPFYAKNGVVKDLLNISKEGFSRCKKHFEELAWIKVLFPKTPKRQLVVLQHPCEFLAQSASTK